jgi:hypothetical protein
MRNLILGLLLAGTANVHAQSPDYILSEQGLGQLKIEMSQTEVEQLLKQKFKLLNLMDKDGPWLDTAKATYKNVPVTLYFVRHFEGEDKFEVVLYGIRISTTHFKTSSGITIGTDKSRIVDAYQSCIVTLWPDFIDDTYTKRSRTNHTASVYCDEDANALYFYMTNKKVKAIEVTRRPSDGD